MGHLEVGALGAPDKPLLIVVAGPTASGKTAVSVELAEKMGGEIISADSMQVYKYMNIGTAKPTAKEQRGIKHYMLDEVYPNEGFSAAEFSKRAELYAREIYAKGKTPILVGGSGFYINAFLTSARFAGEDNDYAYRAELSELAVKFGNGFLHDKLQKIDPVSAETIHCNDVKRVIRALEFYRLTGERISEHNARERRRPAVYDAVFVTLCPDRPALYKRIERRVDIMIAIGLLEEVQRLLEMGYGQNLVSMQGLGYKELVPVVKGEAALSEAVSALKQNTRRFAKRQITWFKNRSGGTWMEIGENFNIEETAENILEMYNQCRQLKDKTLGRRH